MAIVSMSEVKVGLLVVLSVVLLVALTIAVGNLSDFFNHTITIQVTVPSVVGLDMYSPVTYSGVRIGTVTNKRYDETRDQAVVEAKINLDSPVCTDSQVHFTSAGLLSPLFIDISGGSKEKRIRDLVGKGEMNPNQIVLQADPYLSIGEVFAVAGDVKNVLNKVEDILDGLNEPIRDISGFIADASREMTVILKQVEGMLEEGRPRVRMVLDHVNGMVVQASGEVIPTLQDIRKGAEGIPPFVGDTKQQLASVMNKAGGLIDTVSPEVVQVSGEAAKLMSDLRGRLQEIQSSLIRLLNSSNAMVADNRENIDRIVAHLEQTSANLNTLSMELSKNPWRVFWKTDEKRMPMRVSPGWDPIPLDSGENR